MGIGRRVALTRASATTRVAVACGERLASRDEGTIGRNGGGGGPVEDGGPNGDGATPKPKPKPTGPCRDREFGAPSKVEIPNVGEVRSFRPWLTGGNGSGPLRL